MSRQVQKKLSPERELYNRQNRVIHMARAQLGMDLDTCREIAGQINGQASISSLTLEQRAELISILNSKGAKVNNPHLYNAPGLDRGKPAALKKSGAESSGLLNWAPESLAPNTDDKVCPDQIQEYVDEVYPNRLTYWNKRFPNDRPGYATNRQLAWIQSLWELDFNDGRAGKGGLRGFIYRQTQNLENGPVSDLAFLKDEHVMAVITPLKEKARQGISP